MKKFTKPPWAYLSLLIVLMVVSLLTGCTSDDGGNTGGTTEPTNSIVETTESTTENTVSPSTESPTTATTEATTTPTTNPTSSSTQTITPPAAKPIETNPPATNSTEPSGSSTNRKTLYGYDTTTGRTVPEEIVWDHAGYTDLDKLIAWDGVSPLIFIYSDGTVGTEPIEGAQYEPVPGVVSTYVIWRDGAGRADGSTCASCGKTVAHSNSVGVYCVQDNKNWICSMCGAHVTAYTCHTCENYVDGIYYCYICGRRQGDGSNGTCVRWLVGGNHTCSSCGAIVPSNICHTCEDD